jgi:hypothetical protein
VPGPGPGIDPRPEGLHVAVLRVEHALGPCASGIDLVLDGGDVGGQEPAGLVAEPVTRAIEVLGCRPHQPNCPGVDGVVTV